MHHTYVLRILIARTSWGLLFALLMQPPSSYAQRTIDSLRARVHWARSDSARVEALLHLASAFLNTLPDSSYACCLRASTIANGSGRSEDVIEVEGWLGYLAEQRGRLDEALGHYQKSLECAERAQDRKNIPTLLNNIAAIYKDQGKIDRALATHRRSLVIRRALRDSSGIATSLNNIGLIEYDQGRIPDAMEHYAEALHLYEAVNDEEGIATALHNIAGVYRDQGDHAEALSYFQRALALRDPDQDPYGAATTEDNIGGVLEVLGRTSDALVHYERALSLHERSDDTRGMGYSLRNIASIEVKQGNAEEALRHARRASELFDQSSDKRGRASALWMSGLALERLGRPQEAERVTREALTLAQELGYPQVIRDAAGSLDRIYRSSARWREALAMRDLHLMMRDSVLSQEARKSSLRQQYAYAYEKKEADLKVAQKERDLLAHMDLQREKNRRNIILLIGVGTLLITMGLWSRLRFVRRSREQIQHERDIADGLLLNILPAEVASELKSKGRTEAKHYDEVSVLFTDFKGFTSIAEQLTPDELVAEIDSCFQAFDHIMERHGVEKIKTIGDAYMAAGGVPIPRPDAPAAVVQAALEMQDFMDSRARTRTREGKPAFHMRVGIHTGPVVAGIVGVKKFQYDVWGDTVNTASRMESSGEVGRVNISSSTHALLKNDARFHFEPRGQVAAKGKGHMDMWFVTRSVQSLHSIG